MTDTGRVLTPDVRVEDVPEEGLMLCARCDNGDEGLLCEEHAATARALPNGPSLTLRTLSAPARVLPTTTKDADD